MKISLIYDSSDPQAEKIYTALSPICSASSRNLVSIDVSKETLNSCIGCFGCWTRTPGVCVFTQDSGTSFLKKVFDGDFTVFISSIKWGTYSQSVKSYADRLLPLLHPYFVKRNGEMHHQLRYGKMPALLAIGCGARSVEEESTFVSYTNAHRDNMASKIEQGTFIWKSGDEQKGRISAASCAEWLSKEISR